MQRRASIMLAAAAGMVALVSGCGGGPAPPVDGRAEPHPGTSAPTGEEEVGPHLPVAWLVGAGALVLAEVPGSSWTPTDGVRVVAACGPADEHEGWRVLGRLVEPARVTAEFDGGAEFEFELVHDQGLRAWQYLGDAPLRLVERDDDGIDFELHVPLDDAPAWQDVEEVDVEVVFGPERCG